MAIPKRNIRDVRDIRTRSSAVDKTFQPHEAYMRLFCLEMEKARRNKERESALHRVKVIEERFQEIEAEKADLLQVLKNANLALPPGHKPNACLGGLPIQSAENFRVRY